MIRGQTSGIRRIHRNRYGFQYTGHPTRVYHGAKMYYHTSGESHGKGILALVEGFPAGFKVNVEAINAELRRRQGGYGRGARQAIESDSVEFLGGIWQGQTTGAPIAIWVKNKDEKLDQMPQVEYPRPGHADLSGSVKYSQPIRPVLERSSARETAGRVAAGALARQLLESHGIEIAGYVVSLGPLDLRPETELPFDELVPLRNRSVVYSTVPHRDGEAMKLIDEIAEKGDTLGGIVEVRVRGVPVGLGTYVQWDEKLDGRIAQAVMSIQAIKGVEIGLGFEAARRLGSMVHDPIKHDLERGIYRSSNNAGGVEGGMSNGEEIVIRAAMKPIPTLRNPLESVHWQTMQPRPAQYERSDVCAVPATSVVVENVLAMEIARELVNSR